MLFIKILPLGIFILVNSYFLFKNKHTLHNKNYINLNLKKENSENKLDILYKPKTINQNKYADALNCKEDNIIIVTGPAGTGKTLLACNSAINYLKKQNIEKIIITRPVVPVEEDIGFLPGNINKKMDPWTRPIFDIFEEHYSKTNINNMVLNGQIEISPLGFMRGRTFKNSFIIADEMQNSSPNQMYMLLTRIGTNSRLVITGDLEQSDKLENNGLKDLINKIKNTRLDLKNIMLIELNNTDIQRSKLVNQIVKLYDIKTEKKLNMLIDNKLVNKNTISELNNNIISELNKNNTNIIFNKFQNLNPNNDSALIPKHHMFK